MSKVLKVYLKSPGFIFTDHKGKVMRTPSRFSINPKNEELYRSLIKFSSIRDFEIYESEEDEQQDPKLPKLSKIRPTDNVGLAFKIQG